MSIKKFLKEYDNFDSRLKLQLATEIVEHFSSEADIKNYLTNFDKDLVFWKKITAEPVRKTIEMLFEDTLIETETTTDDNWLEILETIQETCKDLLKEYHKNLAECFAEIEDYIVSAIETLDWVISDNQEYKQIKINLIKQLKEYQDLRNIE